MSDDRAEASGYKYFDEAHNESHAYLLPKLASILESLGPTERHLFEIGCGNGSTAEWLDRLGWTVSGIDPSEQGIDHARTHRPELDLRCASLTPQTVHLFGHFPIVLSLEVIEHVFLPREFVRDAFSLLRPGGTLIMSTPYHGYTKNLALAVSGRMDSHFTALWDYGHIKFWSEKTLRVLLDETGFCEIRFLRSGRVAPVAKSMFALAQRPPA